MVTINKHFGICNLLNILISDCITLFNFILVTLIGIGSDYSEMIEDIKNLYEKRDQEELLKINNISNLVETGISYSTFAFAFVVIDMIIRFIQIFNVCCFTHNSSYKRNNSILLVISLCAFCLSFLFIVLSYFQFTFVHKNIIVNCRISDYFIFDLLKEISKGNKFYLLLIISSLINILFYVISFMCNFCLGGITVIEQPVYTTKSEVAEMSEIRIE